MIYLQAEGGLANRLRAIASAYKLASELGTKLTVRWNINSALNCRFYDLFNIIEGGIYIHEHRTNKFN